MDINININTSSNKAESISEYAPIRAKYCDGSIYECFHCENEVPNGILFNKIELMDMLDDPDTLNTELCWDCLLKKFDNTNLKVNVNE